MSTNLKAVEKAEGKPEEATGAAEFTEELPPLHIDPTSFDARAAGVEPCSVVREISKHWSTVAAYELEQEKRRGEVKTPEGAKTYQESWEAEQALRERKRELWLRKWEPKPNEQLEEHIQYIKRKAAQFIDWGDLGQLWNASPRDAIELWKAIRLEARDEFLSGHYGARSFEVMSWQHEAWRRAQYLAVRDGLIEEWKPRGASGFILIDQMTQAYVMQIHWTEVAMTRAHGEPRTESYEFRQWQERRKIEDRVHQWNRGDWDIPYQHQAEAIEQAFRLVELCQKSFQRAARQLANIRLARAKTARARRRDRTLKLKPVKVA
ncbi:MAG TPA: hypothetical protein VER76_19005 [Pyrinomonadaceae bacterium]|nr:hypothetical protein [Pyrinomonadaceae bacterium]